MDQQLEDTITDQLEKVCKDCGTPYQTVETHLEEKIVTIFLCDACGFFEGILPPAN